MRTYYIFNIKKEFKNLYKDSNASLYNIFYNIRKLKYDEVGFGYTFLNQLTRKIEKLSLDNYLYLKMHSFAFYSKKDNIHYYSDGFLNEISNLEVLNGYLRLITNKDISIFLKVLNNYSNDFFVCDFKNTNFYFIDQAKYLV